MNRIRALVLIGIACGLVAALAWFGRRNDETTDGMDRTSRATDDGVPVRLEGLSDAADANQVAPSPDTDANTSPPGAEDGSAENELVLHVIGLPTTTSQDVTASLALLRGVRDRSPPIEGRFDGVETVRFALPLDATKWIVHPTFLVTLTAPATATVREIGVWSDLARRVDDAGHATWRMTIRIPRTVAYSGRVVDPAGRPVPGATLEAYAASAGVLAWRSQSQARADARGHFRIALRPRGEAVLIAHTPERAPGVARVDTRASIEPRSGIVITLPKGHVLAGRLLWQGERPPHAREWTIRYHAGLPGTCGSHVEAWHLDAQGVAHRASGSARVNDDGTFRIAGLARRPHELSARHSSIDQRFNLLDAVGGSITAEPPNDDVTLDLRPAWIDLQLHAQDGGELHDVAIDVRLRNSVWESKGRGLWRDEPVPVRPNSTCVVTLSARDYMPTERTVTSPSAGASTPLQVELRRAQRDASISIRFVGADAGPTRFNLYPVDANGDERVGEYHSRVLEPDQGVYRIDVQPGHWSLLCRPGQTVTTGLPTPWPFGQRHLDVSPTGRHVDIPLQEGALVRVNVRDEDGHGLPAAARLETAAGEAVPVDWLVPWMGAWLGTSENTLGIEGVGITNVPLEPARYIVQVSLKGYTTWRGSVSAVRGETVTVDAVLRREAD